MSDAFYKFSFFLNYSTLLYDGDQMQQFVVVTFVPLHEIDKVWLGS